MRARDASLEALIALLSASTEAAPLALRQSTREVFLSQAGFSFAKRFMNATRCSTAAYETAL